MKKYILSLYVLLFATNIFPQTVEQIVKMPSITPISPNAASLGQFGNFPIGYYTGTPDISIPIYELELDELKFPIVLSYNSSGIRVSQESSWVGLGWALKAGGTITKEIRGGNDFYGNNSINSNGTDNDHGYHFNTWPAWPPRDAQDNIDISYENEEPSLLSILSGTDTQPDLFHFNFGPYSGTMFFEKDPTNEDKTKKPIIQTPVDYLDITFDIDNKIWTILDQYGYKYTFKSTETTEVFETNSEKFNSYFTDIKERIPLRNKMPNIETSWYLDEIESPKGKKIKFTYASELITTPIITSESVHMAIGFETKLQEGNDVIITRDDKVSFNYSFSVIIQKTLKKIEFEGGSIDFTTSERKDIDPEAPSCSVVKNIENSANKPQKLNIIEIKDKQDLLVKKFDFDYYYMGDETKYNNCRLMLHSLSCNTDQKYKFSYIEGDLPDKNTWGTDIWGFYNGPLKYVGGTPYGNIKFKTLPPMTMAYTVFEPSHLPSHATSYEGKYAIPDTLKMQIGTLNMIEYPTGGKSKFIYEPHTFEQGFHVFEGVFGSGSSYISHEPSYSVHQNQRTFYGEDFAVSTNCYAFISAFHVSRYGYGITPPERAIFLYLEKKLQNNQYVEVGKFVHHCMEQPGTTQSDYYYLSPGTYRLKIMKELKSGGGDQPLPNNYLFTGTVNIEERKIPKLNFGGGLRIKEIHNMENDKILSKKKYLYKKNNNNNSSGVLIKKPNVANMVLMDRNVADFFVWSTIDDLGENVMRNAFVTPYVSFSGSSNLNIGYSRVEEINEDVEGNYNGKTIYNYFVEKIKQQVLIPGFPDMANPANGSLLELKQYNKDNYLIHKNNKNYEETDGQTSKLVTGLTLYHTDTRCGAKFYDLKSKRWAIKDETAIDYFNNGKDSIVNKTYYQYHSKNWQINNIQTTDSRNKIQEKRIKYATDYNDDISSKMTNKNMIGIPIETINLVDNLVQSATKTIYSDVSNMILPSNLHILETTVPLSINAYSQKYSSKLKFEKYDNHGNPLYITESDANKIVYLWSYNYQYPIAEIKNATFSAVETVVKKIFSVANVNDLSTLSVPNETKLKDGSLQKALPDALVTTYTYKPLIGLLSATDPTGITTYYNYDSSGRLKETYIIEDNVKKILQSYTYHYQNQ